MNETKFKTGDPVAYFRHEAEIVIKCKCGKLLTETKRETESMYGDRLAITVEPCIDCMVENYDEGYDRCKEDHEIDQDDED